MVRTFRGEGPQKVDAKGRVSIPASYRPVLRDGDPNWSEGKPPEFVIVYGDDRRNYLECFTIDSANDVDAKIARLPRGSRQRKRLQTLFNGQSLPATVDDTGRIVLPQKLREKLGIENEAYFIAMGDTFQIWNPETYGATEADDDIFDELPEGADEWALMDMVGDD